MFRHQRKHLLVSLFSGVDNERAGVARAHCWKKKRDFLIIMVGGFLILTVDGNEYFVG